MSRKSKSQKNKRNVAEETPIIQQLCKQRGWELKQVQPWHFRIAHKGKCVDVYPGGGRSFDLATKQWGHYVNVEVFLTQFFANEPAG